MDILDTLLKATDSLGSKILLVATLLAAIGTIAMTLVETVANLWRGQMRLHRALFHAWVRADLTAVWSRMHAMIGKGDQDTPDRKQMEQVEPNEAERQFLGLACGDPRHAQILFDQPTDKFAAQLQAAANVALEYPTQYAALYRFLTKPVEAQPDRSAKTDSDLWYAFSSNSATDPSNDKTTAAAMKARARLGNLVSRRLDVFQNAARYRWDRLRQWSGSLLAGLLAAVVATQVSWSGREALIPAFVLLAGAMAPFANDVVNRLGSFRRKA